MRQIVDEQLQELILQYESSNVRDAAEYSLLAPGKRVRPLLMLALIKDYGSDPYLGLDVACAIECIQTYSIVHDDLPAMDDDDFRRGQPTNHKVYGEALAILAGDSLLTMAFEVLAQSNYSDDKKIKLIDLFAKRAGMNGMILGQTLDLSYETQPCESLEDLLTMYDLKTGCLLSLALEAAAILVEKDKDREVLKNIGYRCGRAFQIQDDIFDVVKTSEEIGKTVGSDKFNNKTTALAFMTIEEANELVVSLYAQIREDLFELKLINSEIYTMIEYLMSRQS